MPTQPRELWSDWFPGAANEPQVTIDELVRELAKTHPDVTRTQIRYWQSSGIIPMPLRRRHGGATRALYPLTSASFVIRKLWDLKQQRYTLPQIGPRLRAFARNGNAQDHDEVRSILAAMARLMESGGTDILTGAEVRFFTESGQERAVFFNIAPILDAS